jgi:GNAT superfamily N-acetyltransferase
MSMVVRQAQPGDGSALRAMVEALAISHGHEKDFVATAADFEGGLFGQSALIGALIAEVDGSPAGCAIWHRSFSTFRGRETMYLEDLSVLPQFRRRGVATALLKALARLAVKGNVPSVTWLMMAWNDAGRALYEAAGAEVEDGNCLCRLHGDALRSLGQ